MSEAVNIWDHASMVDPACTKSSDVGYKATSINGYWFIKTATELWGPCGQGWGYEILEERFDEGSPILDKETRVPLCKTVMHTTKLRLWYMIEGEEKSLIQYGHTPYIYNTRNHGPTTDTEAPKKSLMDAIKKCLSMLGFASDVYLGEWDDPAYVAMRQAESDIEGADDKEERLKEELSKIEEKCSEYLNLMGGSKQIQELDKIHKAGVRYFSGLQKSRSKEIVEVANSQLGRLQKGYQKRNGQLKGEQQ